MLEELELKKEAYQRAFIYNSMCTTTDKIEKMWNRPDLFPEIYQPGKIELRNRLDMTEDRAHAMLIYKLRSDILKEAVNNIQWKIDFIEKNKKSTWWQRIKNSLSSNKHIISLKSLQQ